MIGGEYAVLEGYPCIVAAVSARAQVSIDHSAPPSSSSPDSRSAPPEAVLAREEAEKICGAIEGELVVDVSELRQVGKKLGLGSSAAAAAGAAAVVFAAHHRDLDELATRRQVLDAAMAGHGAVSPKGSGADVAAAVLGGFLQFRRSETSFTAEPIPWPKELIVRVVWTGTEARTSDLVARVHRLADTDSARYSAAITEIAHACGDLTESLQNASIEGAIPAVDRHHAAMRELGHAARAPIVTDRLDLVASLARESGGAAKPSGAGGGDVAVAVFRNAEDARRFDQACEEHELTLLSDLRLGGTGAEKH